jgi:hypothetical protein
MAAVNKRVGFCSVLLIIVAAVALLYGLMYCFIPTPAPYHLKYMQIEFEELKSSSPRIAKMLMINLRVIGVNFLALGILALGIALGPFKRAERWVWITAFPALLVLLIPILLVSIKIGGVMPISASGLTLVLTLLSFLISAGDFFAKKA